MQTIHKCQSQFQRLTHKKDIKGLLDLNYKLPQKWQFLCCSWLKSFKKLKFLFTFETACGHSLYTVIELVILNLFQDLLCFKYLQGFCPVSFNCTWEDPERLLRKSKISTSPINSFEQNSSFCSPLWLTHSSSGWRIVKPNVCNTPRLTLFAPVGISAPFLQNLQKQPQLSYVPQGHFQSVRLMLRQRLVGFGYQ